MSRSSFLSYVAVGGGDAWKWFVVVVVVVVCGLGRGAVAVVGVAVAVDVVLVIGWVTHGSGRLLLVLARAALSCRAKS